MKANEFGLYIRKLRNEKEMTIRQLELYSGVSNSYLSQLENGKRGIPSPDIIKKISNGLKVDYNDLMIKAGYMDKELTSRKEIDSLSDEEVDEELKEFMSKLKVWYKNAPENKREELRLMRNMLDFFDSDE